MSIVNLALAAVLLTAFNHPGTHHAAIEPKNVVESNVKSTDYGGKLYLSDSPETVTADGILYQDTVNGDGRVFFHHVNGMDQPKQFAVIFENSGANPVHILVSRHGIGGPSEDYLAVGKTAQQQYIAGQNAYYIEVPAGKVASLLTNEFILNPDMLVSGIYDFKTDGAVTLKVLMLPVGTDLEKFAKQAPVLSADIEHLRGTFPSNSRMLVPSQPYKPSSGKVFSITLADNGIDRYVRGIDATDGSSVVDYGNYGILYNISLPSVSGAKLNYYLNPLGGVYAGAVGVEYQHSPVAVVDTPAGQTFFGTDTLSDVSLIGQYASGQSLWLTFSPPGSSNLPVRLLAVPQK